MRSKMVDFEYFPAGAIVSCTTVDGSAFRGEVLAFDETTKMLQLKCEAISKKPGLHDINTINTMYLTNVELEKEAPEHLEPLPMVNFSKLKSKYDSNVKEKYLQAQHKGVNVTPEAQLLFNHIAKTIPHAIKWDAKTIVVFDTVKISPPYKVDDVTNTGEDAKSASTFDHIKKLVERFHMDNGSAQRDPSVSSSSSSTQ